MIEYIKGYVAKKKLVDKHEVTLLDIMSPDEINEILTFVITMEECDKLNTTLNYTPKRKIFRDEADEPVGFGIHIDREVYNLIKAYAKKNKYTIYKMTQYLLVMGLKYEAEQAIKKNEK